MKAAIGVYDTHEKAIAAIEKLKQANYPIHHLSILGKADKEIVVDENGHVVSENPIKPAGLGIGVTLGVALGILTGAGVFLIPGFGFLFGAGAVAGAVAGLDVGLVGGGIATILTSLGVSEDLAKKYHTDLDAGKFLLIAQGTDEDINKAKSILTTHGTHEQLLLH